MCTTHDMIAHKLLVKLSRKALYYVMHALTVATF